MQQSIASRPGLVHADESQLVIVDIQSRLGEGMPAKVANRVIQNAILLARSASVCEVPVVLTEQQPAMLGATYSDVRAAAPEGTPTIEKTSFSVQRAADFAGVMSGHSAGRNQIILVGMEAHISILQSAIELSVAGHEVFVVEDAVCSRRLENYQNALDRLRQNGIFVVSAESIVFEWIRDQSHPAFAAVQNWLR